MALNNLFFSIYFYGIIFQFILTETVENSSLVSVNEKVIPRFCRLCRDSREEQYGFDFKTLKNDGIHIATNVRDGHPAQKAGLRNGDYIIEVNGKSIEQIEHEAVVTLIFSNYKQVDLLVVEDLKGYKKYRKQHEKAEKRDTIESAAALASAGSSSEVELNESGK
jgi:predicted metalloprotease with PDZ domain